MVINKIWVRHGSVAIAGQEVDGCAASGEFPTFELDESRVSPRWIHWYTKLPSFWKDCAALSQGTSGKNRIKPDLFLSINIPLPPLAEQQRIVARIDALAARIEEAKGLRAQAMVEVDRLLPTAAKQIRVEVLQRFPKTRVGKIASVTSGGTPARKNPDYWDGDIPWIKTGELVDGDIDEAEEHITELGLEESSAKLFPPNTVLIALYGQGQTRGRTGRLMIFAATNQACCAILPTPKYLEPRFLQHWLRSLYHDMRKIARDGAQPNWNGRMIKNIEIATPPIMEQRRIVAYLDDLQAKVEAVKRLQTETQAELAALLPSLLDRAFRGEL